MQSDAILHAARVKIEIYFNILTKQVQSTKCFIRKLCRCNKKGYFVLNESHLPIYLNKGVKVCQGYSQIICY